MILLILVFVLLLLIAVMSSREGFVYGRQLGPKDPFRCLQRCKLESNECKARHTNEFCTTMIEKPCRLACHASLY